ncbi:MAG: SPOR domain-containing protein [Candidatus Omnitrophica bacterium]|nr:SPOR domain-containing protein [Candidatus Omnitrophota bacterium]
MSNEYQKELFDEFKQGKGKFEKIVDKINVKRKKLYIHAPLENAVFTVIIVVMCIIVAFALGVERGKRFTSLETREESAVFKEAVTTPQIKLSPIEIGKPEAKEPVTAPKAASAPGLYTIQLISYKQESIAEAEKNKLLNKNVNAYIIRSGNWYQVCAGGYGTMEKAKAALLELEKEYKGSFIRKGAD